ncbi:hypothetical protein HBB16_06355 [Pseudonocardia sp. MCCB 268]|nr:hypothetical protein [Pseudonocardia cytotoxica]
MDQLSRNDDLLAHLSGPSGMWWSSTRRTGWPHATRRRAADDASIPARRAARSNHAALPTMTATAARWQGGGLQLFLRSPRSRPILAGTAGECTLSILPESCGGGSRRNC